MRDAGADASCANPSGWREKGAQPLLEMQEDRRGKGESLVLAVGGLVCWVQAVGGSGGLSQQEGRKTEEGGQSPMKHVGLEGIVCRPFNGDKYVGNGERGPQLRRKEGRRTIWLNPTRQSLSLAISYYWSMKVASTRTQGRGQLESNFIKIPRRGRWNNI